ncbi:hypothetical protein B0T14DRAFT_272661 [Immersiella caudata]|uniref:Uncharacterized protein n=1 Tax=Immersiella caudata TaxID=314043 RepID=A0AA40BXS2_9PEZI|nr:hypothetical protein B0T14DRAFT_272661 [Immersiella caudata]
MERVPATLLSIPREVRDMIYREFLLIDAEDGYVYNPDTGKLQTAGRQPIELTLMYTCRQIAAEMSGAALRLHTVNFTTIPSRRAWKWDYIITRQWKSLQSILSFVLPWTCKRPTDTLTGMTSEERALCGANEPFQSLFTHQQTLRRIIRHLAATNDDIESFVSTAYLTGSWTADGPNDSYDHDPLRFLSVGTDPWSIPTNEEMNCTLVNTPTLMHEIDLTRATFDLLPAIASLDANIPCRFSAGAAAISWLNSISSNARENVRKIVVHEDQASAVYPETHTQGLIPLCEKYPLMKVERRVDLWSAVWWKLGSRHFDHDKRSRGQHATKLVANWVNEASSCPPNFALVFDGGMWPNKAAPIFQMYVQRDAAWQVTFEKAFKEGSKDSFDAFRSPPKEPYFGKNFPALLRAISDKSSHIRCNFDAGTTWTEAQMPEIRDVLKENATDIRWLETWRNTRKGNPPSNVPFFDTDTPEDELRHLYLRMSEIRDEFDENGSVSPNQPSVKSIRMEAETWAAEWLGIPKNEV